MGDDAPGDQQDGRGEAGHPQEEREEASDEAGHPQGVPLRFTPLVSEVEGLAVPLYPPRGVNVAVGVDIIEVERVRKVFEHHGERFLKRVFTDVEVQQCRGKVTRLAGRFAAKEAISKALGTGMHGVSWREMEIVQLHSGRPSVRLHGNAKRRAVQLGLSAFDVSMSDLKTLAIAIAVAIQTNGGAS